MDDTISRQAAIEAIEKARANVGHNMERAVGAAFIEILDEVGEDIGRLPSIQFATDTNVGTKLGTNLAEVGTDLISRQALLKQIDIDSDGEPGYYGDTWKFIDTIKSLPSAQPENKQQAINSSDCISRQTAIETVMECYDNDELFEVYEDKLRELPPTQPAPSQVAKDITRIVENGQDMRVIAQPEIIRCKDCKHWIPYDWMFSEVWQSKNRADYPEDEIGCNLCDMAMKANDFCSRAERREE